jgi:hypothetical protein
MRHETLATIVLTLLGMTAAAGLAWLSPGAPAHAQQRKDYHYRRSRLVMRDGQAPVRAGAPRVRRPAPASPMPDRPGAAEKMVCGGLTRDFGEVPPGTQLLHRFPIVNVYSAPMTIAYLQTSCDCVTATVGKRTLEPGESTTIDVRLDAGHFSGENMQNVRVKVAGPDFESVCKLVVSAVSRADAPPGACATAHDPSLPVAGDGGRPWRFRHRRLRGIFTEAR